MPLNAMQVLIANLLHAVWRPYQKVLWRQEVGATDVQIGPQGIERKFLRIVDLVRAGGVIDVLDANGRRGERDIVQIGLSLAAQSLILFVRPAEGMHARGYKHIDRLERHVAGILRLETIDIGGDVTIDVKSQEIAC